MRRKDREMDIPFGEEVIDNSQYGVLSLREGDGVYSIPLSIVRDKSKLYFHCALEGKKTSLISDGDTVSAVFVSYAKVPNLFSEEELKEVAKNKNNITSKIYTTEYSSAIVVGKIYKVTEEIEKISALRFICEKYTPDMMDYFSAAIDSSLSKTDVYKIEVENLTSKRKKFGKDREELKFMKKE